jgi:hypothetical protein
LDGIVFLIVILASQEPEGYSRVKFYGDVKYGIHTVCVFPKQNANRKPKLNVAPGYLANLALKINLKLGGVNHQIHSRETPVLPNKTLYIGIDVTHPTGADSVPEAPSIAGVVVNSDSTLGQWPASLRTQGHRVEIVQSLIDMLLERLGPWKKDPPEKVIVYRDGVSESQYDQVVELELPDIRKALQTAFSDAKQRPRITLMVVAKRHHTRFLFLFLSFLFLSFSSFTLRLFQMKF